LSILSALAALGSGFAAAPAAVVVSAGVFVVVAFGFYLRTTWRRPASGRRRRILVTVSVVIVAAVVAATAAASLLSASSRGRSEGGRSQVGASADHGALPRSTTSAGSAVSGTTPVDDPALVFDGKVTLHARTGADLDAKQTEGSAVNGLVEGIDLYLDEYGFLKATGGRIYQDIGPRDPTKERCARIVDTADRASVIPMQGLQYCAVTSDNRLVSLYVDSAEILVLSMSNYAAINVLMWNR
jgi:hypothetical protein